MNEQLRAFQLSIGIHGVFALAVLGLSSGFAVRTRPAVLDLSLLGGAPAPAREKLLHPRARFDPGAPAAQPPKTEEPSRPQVQRVNVSPDMAPVAAAADAPAAEPEQAPGISRDAVRERYVNENFTYIRDLIHRNLFYPQLARKMGWSGRVVVSFILGVDGCVKDAKVISSCGHEVLDRSALETIKRGSPYPAPPVEAELVMPITYRLE